MKVLALDISTKTGWAVFEDGKLTKYDTIRLPKKIGEYGKYPWSYLTATETMAQQLVNLAQKEFPDAIVIEETNNARSRYSQKALEYIHCCFLYKWAGRDAPVYYINSSAWRSALGLVLSKDDKKNNKKLKVAKKLAEATEKKLDRVVLGIRGMVSKKHIAIRYVNETFGLTLKVKDNDQADAICLGLAYLKGAKVCDGK